MIIRPIFQTRETEAQSDVTCPQDGTARKSWSWGSPDSGWFQYKEGVKLDGFPPLLAGWRAQGSEAKTPILPWGRGG